ncbi:MAG: DNA cytosine methyltransferase [Acidobacteriota bacterium]|nr:DNA cytosine methyltransferase [Acidobacteriota bacterium]
MDLAARLHPNAQLIAADIEEIEPGDLSPVDLLHVTLPCTRFSVAERNRQKSHPEAQPDATSVWGFLRLLETLNPAILVFESVVAARNSASYCLIRAALRKMGYCLHAAILDSFQAGSGSLESRRRRQLIAVSAGLGQPNMFEMPRFEPAYRTLAEALEPVPIDGELPYLVAKEAHDGGAFKRQLVSEASTYVGTIGAGYHKRRSSEPMLQHAGKERLLTPMEHARAKGVPESIARTFLACICPSLAHRMLGQSILWNQGRAIGQILAGNQGSKKVGQWEPALGGAPCKRCFVDSVREAQQLSLF